MNVFNIILMVFLGMSQIREAELDFDMVIFLRQFWVDDRLGKGLNGRFNHLKFKSIEMMRTKGLKSSDQE